MLFHGLLSFFALTASTLPTPPRSSDTAAHNPFPIDAWNITNFDASAVILSNRVYYRFNVQYDPDHEPVECSALGTTLSEELSSIPLTQCGEENSTVAFQWTLKEDGSATLLVKRDLQATENATEEAMHWVSKNQTAVVGSGFLAHMTYEGPENFTIPAWRYKN